MTKNVCTSCNEQCVILNSEDYVEDAEFYQSVCSCDAEEFEILVGVSLYPSEVGLSDNVRWVYIGCRCPKCNLVGCYADWKNEYSGYESLFRNT